MLFPLSFHGLFEGIAMGLQNSSDGLRDIAIAVFLHKWAESFVLGVSLKKGNKDLKLSIVLLFIFSITTPLGILIGAFISEAALVSAIFFAISAGTFLYIATTEIIVEEFSNKENKWLKLFVLCIAVAFICLLKNFAKHDH